MYRLSISKGSADDDRARASEAATDTTTRMLYSGALEKAHGWLNSRGVSVGPILTDRQGTRYFAMQDLEGNPLEVSEEP